MALTATTNTEENDMLKEFFLMLTTNSKTYKKEQDKKFADDLAELNHLAKTTGNTPTTKEA